MVIPMKGKGGDAGTAPRVMQKFSPVKLQSVSGQPLATNLARADAMAMSKRGEVARSKEEVKIRR